MPAVLVLLYAPFTVSTPGADSKFNRTLEGKILIPGTGHVVLKKATKTAQRPVYTM